MSVSDDDKNALGWLGRQEILTVLMIIVFGTFSVTVAVILILTFTHPEIISSITISGDIDLGGFIDRFDELLMAFLVLLGVSIGAKMKK
jgi:hypothetical protein